MISDGHKFQHKEDDSEIIRQLKEKFSTASRSEKIQILILPKSWPIRKLQEEFNTSNFMARKAKQLVKQKGILSTPYPKHGHTLSQTTVDLVCTFYESEDVLLSRMMPSKDYVSVRTSDGRVHAQKKLILCNLRELYQLFKDNYLNEKIGFSTFASLCPKHCVLAGGSGTHSVCVCTFHQNVKLMMHGVKLPELRARDGTCFETCNQCIAHVIFNPPQPKCYIGNCSECPGTEESLTDLLDENAIANITYQQWVAVDRSTLVTTCKTSEEFVEEFVQKVNTLISHFFIAKQQA